VCIYRSRVLEISVPIERVAWQHVTVLAQFLRAILILQVGAWDISPIQQQPRVRWWMNC
jgi:hypothetical protein